jgi:hypothetical protein
LLQSLCLGKRDQQLTEGIPIRFLASERLAAHGDSLGIAILCRDGVL